MRIIHSTAAALFLATSLVGVSAFAQGNAAGQQGTTGATGANDTSGASGQQGGSMKTVSAADQAFFDKAYRDAQGNLAIGKVAASKGATPQVKKLGTLMQDDATAELTKLRSFAEKTNAIIPTGLNPVDQNELTALGKESGAKFDQSFLTHVRAHHAAQIGEMEAEAKNGHNPELKTLASNEVDVLRAQEQQAGTSGVTNKQAPNKGATEKQNQGQQNLGQPNQQPPKQGQHK
jgi:putative membrane protein